MFASLAKIKNPLARSGTAAATIGSVVTIVSSLVIEATNTKVPSAYRAAIYAALAGIGGGAVLGLITASRQDSDQKEVASQGGANSEY